MSYFYEIRSPDNTVLKRDGGFPDREAATAAAREDAKHMAEEGPECYCPATNSAPFGPV